VSRLPSGLDTGVGDRGMRLSGGERQRIALARALLRKPRLLVLDEATSAVDAENERRILDAIGRLHGRLTIVIITHRMASLRCADKIYVLEQGHLIEAGSWDTLTSAPGGRLRDACLAQGILLHECPSSIL
jgi:ATP-binding cassette subfamily C protein